MADTLKESVLELLLKSPNGLTWEEITNQVSYDFESHIYDRQKKSTYASGLNPLLKAGTIIALGERGNTKYFVKALLLKDTTKKQVKPEETNLSDLERLLLAYINGDLQVLPAMLDAIEEKGAPRPKLIILYWIRVLIGLNINTQWIDSNMNRFVCNTALELEAYTMGLQNYARVSKSFIYFGTDASEVKDRILKAHKHS